MTGPFVPTGVTTPPGSHVATISSFFYLSAATKRTSTTCEKLNRSPGAGALSCRKTLAESFRVLST